MIRKIALIGDEVLTKVAAPVLVIDDRAEVDRICQDLRDTLKSGKMWAKGLAIAAPQIGESKRIVYLNFGKHEDLILINPTIVEATGRVKHKEMCLSIPGAFKRTLRKQSVTVTYLDERELKPMIKTFSGMDAIVIQHELDHLDGKLISDRDN